jgi:alkylation response protein AidB-like acyl-CoA dehydrogenase
MLTYTPPLKDMQFVLEELLDAPATLGALPAFSDIDASLMRQVTGAAGRFAADILMPLNASGDRDGCRFEAGVVSTPPGFAHAYRQFCDAGWPALACAAEFGGQGLPQALNSALYEMLSAANHGWSMYPGLLQGAYDCLKLHASEALKARYLPKLVSGEWLATMCLTEAHAGSDLGLLRTRAVPEPDGSARISGSKIFISGGDQDLTDNIVHLVLARLPDAPGGSRGLSLFLVPKLLPAADGTRHGLGKRNAVHCRGIEHKMGIRASATCSLDFDGATGWLVGAAHGGLAAMFVMMNASRLHVGLQALGIAETAYQNSLAYARQRLQLKAVERPPRRRDLAADPIVLHPAVQRLLMGQRASVEGGRMLAYWTAMLLDRAEHDPDPATRAALHGQVGLITPVVKSMLTEQGFLGASQAMQVYGGHGFIGDTGIEQALRDVRVTMMYEGTNEIQAVDLVMRKVLADGGARLQSLLDELDRSAQAECDGSLAPYAASVLQLARRTREIPRRLAEAAASHPAVPYRVAAETLRLVGHCALAWLWLRAARAALAMQARDPAFAVAKLATTCYYFTYLLPEVDQLFGVIDACLRGDGGRGAFPSDLTANADQAA